MIAGKDESIPDGCVAIYHARITCEIVRIKWSKKYKDKFIFEDVYKENSEKDERSYFMLMLRRKFELDKSDEELKVVEIQKLKLIGFSQSNT